jgi:4'-phosphopantetheinyl transferase
MDVPKDPWLAPPQRVACGEGEVHVWLASLEQEPQVVRALYGTLSAEERQRADRFHFARDRERFAVARGVLRDILGRYLDIRPADIGFSYSPYGKPSLAEGSGGGGGGLRFNVSHSHGLALYAFARGGELGLDIEYLRDDLAGLDVAERFFSPAEVVALRGLPAELRTAAFFNCWTRKEAYIKALGEGLSHPLHRFSVSLVPGEPAALLHAEDDPSAPARWWMTAPPVAEGYAAAVVAEGGAGRIGYWRWRRPAGGA